MGGKNRHTTREATSSRRDKLERMPAAVPDTEHLADERHRELPPSPDENDWIYDYDGYDDYYCTDYYIDAFEATVEEAIRRYSAGEGLTVPEWPNGRLGKLCLKYSQNKIDHSALESTPRCELFPARFGCWVDDGDVGAISSHAVNGKRPRTTKSGGKSQDAKDRSTYNWYNQEAAAAESFTNRYQYVRGIYRDYGEATTLNPYVPTRVEWDESQRQEKLRSAKAKLAAAKKMEGVERPAAAKPSALRKATNEVSVTCGISTVNRFGALAKKKR